MALIRIARHHFPSFDITERDRTTLNVKLDLKAVIACGEIATTNGLPLIREHFNHGILDENPQGRRLELCRRTKS